MNLQPIILIDDHEIFRAGVRMVIQSCLADAVIFEAGTLNQALNLNCDAPVLVLLDIKLPGLNGCDGIDLLKRKWPGAKVLVLSSQDEPEMVRLTQARGAAGFISKARSADDIMLLICRTLSGQTEAFDAVAIAAAPPPHLTPRQLEVLELLCQGLSNKLIGRKLGLSENTVRGHVQAILAFLGVASRAEAAFAARCQGLVN